MESRLIRGLLKKVENSHIKLLMPFQFLMTTQLFQTPLLLKARVPADFHQFIKIQE